ncbi:unnamed protein product [Prunus armeniaca]
MAERRLSRLGGKREVSSSPYTGWQRDTVVVHGVQSDEEANPSTRIGGRNLGADKNEKWKKITQFHLPNSAIVKDFKAGSISQARYFNCGEAGHKSYTCPQRRIRSTFQSPCMMFIAMKRKLLISHQLKENVCW